MKSIVLYPLVCFLLLFSGYCVADSPTVLSLGGPAVLVSNQTSYAFQVTTPSNVFPFQRIQFVAWLPTNNNTQSIGNLTISQFPTSSVVCQADYLPIAGICQIWTPIAKLKSSSVYNLSILGADGSQFYIQANLVGDSPIVAQPGELFIPYSLNVTNQVGYYSFLQLSIPPDSTTKLYQVSFLYDKVPPPYGPVQFFFSMNFTSSSFAWGGRAIDGMQTSLVNPTILIAFGDSQLAQSSSYCNWQPQGGFYTLAVTSAIPDRSFLSLSAPPALTTWPVMVQITEVEAPQFVPFSVNSPVPYEGNCTSAVGRVDISVGYQAVMNSYLNYSLLYLPTTQSDKSPANQAVNVKEAWKIEVRTLPNPSSSSSSSSSALAIDPYPPMPILFASASNSHSAVPSSPFFPFTPGPFTCSDPRSNVNLFIPGNANNDNKLLFKTVLASPCLLSQGAELLLGIYGTTGMATGDLLKTALYNLTVSPYLLETEVIPSPTTENYPLQGMFNDSYSYLHYEYQFPSSSSSSSALALYAVQVQALSTSRKDSLFWEVGKMPYLPSDSTSLCGGSFNGEFGTTPFVVQSWCLGLPDPLRPSSVYLTVICTNCNTYQLNATTSVVALEPLVIATNATGVMNVSTTNTTTSGSSENFFLYEMDSSSSIGAVTFDFQVKSTNQSDTTWSAVIQVGSGLGSAGQCQYLLTCMPSPLYPECSVTLTHVDLQKLRATFPLDVASWGVVGVVSGSSSNPNHPPLVVSISVTETNSK